MARIDDRDPYDVFAEWYADAGSCGIKEPTAVALATADSDGQPSLRMVLLKGYGPDGFVFYTNYESRKGQELLSNPKAALCFHWMPLERQVRVQGRVEQVTAAEANAYFASRHRDSQLGAWASQQSRPMATAYDLEKNVAKMALKFNIGTVPRPPYWSGFRIVPHRIEFWAGKPFRLHERVVFSRDGDEAPWTTERLFP
ncbi:MAG: pyridoxamine 5'-phosphate oxidase [Rhodospirillaceae bacterium]|nr:pyridoxamine 5'-phosphate oxidase [Rhodospirillaceae bacterium]MBT6202336.1 pyridoxamine 5'-phosphate oxidase [Rhodospirillaceae bacterium]MBT6512533.1 pyridoxamine 5'-phosphate oxidase [Rhodospirillaceae bacterium]MBT7613472.1 pyridoxamine 5'-phosphate oxidase [Rhodospirillaceae bacterium]MBT7647238.1 pyridoxamine 5'-phosphate oxidase [Rhodospirillaceae bacterium]